MELYCLVGGEANSVKRWQEDLSAQFYPVYKKGKKLKAGKDIIHRRLIVAPVQLYKIAFPQEELDNVVNAVCPNPYIEERYKPIKLMVRSLRKVLGLKNVPKPTNPNALLQPNQLDKAVFVAPIGLKKDHINKEGSEHV